MITKAPAQDRNRTGNDPARSSPIHRRAQMIRPSMSMALHVPRFTDEYPKLARICPDQKPCSCPGRFTQSRRRNTRTRKPQKIKKTISAQSLSVCPVFHEEIQKATIRREKKPRTGQFFAASRIFHVR
ncbi:MAG: hypothetical protein K6360_07035 [Deltaproteobacteria bacterium]